MRVLHWVIFMAVSALALMVAYLDYVVALNTICYKMGFWFKFTAVSIFLLLCFLCYGIIKFRLKFRQQH